MTAIAAVHGREILDSRGNPTVEVDVTLDDGSFGRAAVPSGASTGKHEALELRDRDDKRYGGKGVLTAVSNVENVIAPELAGVDALDQRDVDRRMLELDGTLDKSNLGANAILGVSLATAHAAAASLGVSLFRYLGGPSAHLLPVPMFNVINGGAHADNSIDVQEFMLAPLGAASFSEALRWGSECFHALGSDFKQKGFSTDVGDEGGYAPDLPGAAAALEAMVRAIESVGLEAGVDVAVALDVAASEMYSDGSYKLEGAQRDASAMASYYEELIGSFPLVSIEDPLAEDDWEGWTAVTDSS